MVQHPLAVIDCRRFIQNNFKQIVLWAHARCSCSVAANHSALSRPTLGFESRHEHYPTIPTKQGDGVSVSVIILQCWQSLIQNNNRWYELYKKTVLLHHFASKMMQKRLPSEHEREETSEVHIDILGSGDACPYPRKIDAAVPERSDGIVHLID